MCCFFLCFEKILKHYYYTYHTIKKQHNIFVVFTIQTKIYKFGTIEILQSVNESSIILILETAANFWNNSAILIDV